MEQSPWETNRFSASQEIPHILLNPKVHYRNHKRLQPVRNPNLQAPINTYAMGHIVRL